MRAWASNALFFCPNGTGIAIAGPKTTRIRNNNKQFKKVKPSRASGEALCHTRTKTSHKKPSRVGAPRILRNETTAREPPNPVKVAPPPQSRQGWRIHQANAFLYCFLSATRSRFCNYATPFFAAKFCWAGEKREVWFRFAQFGRPDRKPNCRRTRALPATFGLSMVNLACQ